MPSKKKKKKTSKKKSSKSPKKKLAMPKKRAKKVARPKKKMIHRILSGTEAVKSVQLKENKEETVHKTKVRVIGIGGGGGSIVSEIASKIKKADFLVANTDLRALNDIRKRVKKFHFGQNFTRGLGTGMNPDVGEMAAENEREKIKNIFAGQDLCIIISCLGGGTSSGSTPTFAKAARSMGALTFGIFTMPFAFEGEKKMEMAKNSLEKIKSHLNAYAVIPNERIFQIIDKNTPLKTALSAINRKLAENLEGILEMVYLPGLINIDFADLRTILEGRGRLAYANTMEVEKDNEEESVKKVINSSLYPYGIKGARGILYDITGGKDLQLSEVSQISKIISESINKSAKIIFGISQKSDYNNKIKVTVLATGCASKVFGPSPSKTLSPLVSTIRKIKSNISRDDKANPGKPEQPNEKAPSPEGKPKNLKAPEAKKTTLTKKSSVGKIMKPITSKSNKKIKRRNKTLKIKEKESENSETKVRRSALEVKKVAEEEEKKILDQEKVWETPAIFRNKQIQQ